MKKFHLFKSKRGKYDYLQSQGPPFKTFNIKKCDYLNVLLTKSKHFFNGSYHKQHGQCRSYY